MVFLKVAVALIVINLAICVAAYYFFRGTK